MKKYLIIAIFALILMCGCSKEKVSDSIDKDVTSLKKFKNATYNADTDYQSFLSEYSDVVLVDNGYYASYDGFLYYIDKAAINKTFVCSNPNCMHNNVDCDAYLGDASSLQYYNGNLYYVVYEGNKAVVCSRTLDSSVISEICSIDSTDVIPLISVHRGYAFYALFDGNDSCSLFRVKLESKAVPEKIYTCRGFDSQIYKINGYGDGVLFVNSIALDEEYNSFNFRILYYDIDENAVKSVAEDAGGSYAVSDDRVYYWKKDAVYCYTPDKNETTAFYKTDEPVFVSFDGENFYFDNKYGINIGYTDSKKHTVYVVNREGVLLDAIKLSDTICCYGDKDYLFQTTSNGYMLLDKKQIRTGDFKWINMPLSVKIEEQND